MVTRVRSGKGKINFVTPELYFDLGKNNFKDLSIENKRLYWRKSARILEAVLERNKIDCKNAEATVEADRVRILNWIEEDVGTEFFNDTITQLITDEITRLRMTAGPTNPNASEEPNPLPFNEQKIRKKGGKRKMKRRPLPPGGKVTPPAAGKVNVSPRRKMKTKIEFAKSEMI